MGRFPEVLGDSLVNLGRLAQLARASPLQGEGRGFESLNAHHLQKVAVLPRFASPLEGDRQDERSKNRQTDRKDDDERIESIFLFTNCD